MKNVIYGIVCAIITVGFLFLVTTVSVTPSREKDISTNLMAAVNEAVDNATLTKHYTVSDTTMFVSDIVLSLLSGYDNESNLSIEIVSCDVNTGLVIMDVTQDYKMPNGKDKSVTVSKAVILENDMEQADFTITYMWENEDYAREEYVYKTQKANSDEATIILSASTDVEYAWVDSNGKVLHAGDSVYVKDNLTLWFVEQ